MLSPGLATETLTFPDADWERTTPALVCAAAVGLLEMRLSIDGDILMTIHFQALNTTSCGRTGVKLATTQDQAQVSCKSCLRSLEKAEASPIRVDDSHVAVKVEVTKKPECSARAPHRQAAPAPHTNAKSIWRTRLANMAGRNRLPRGGSQQVYI